MPDLRHGGWEVVVDGDMARVGTMAASFAGVEGSGRSSNRSGGVTHLRDGKVIEAWEIADIAALRAQVEG